MHALGWSHGERPYRHDAIHRAVDVVRRVGGADAREVASRREGAGRLGRGWPTRRRTSGARDARWAVPDAAWRVSSALCPRSSRLSRVARGAVHRPRDGPPGSRRGLRLRAGCGLRARPGRDSWDRPRGSERPEQPVCRSPCQGRSQPGSPIDTVGRFGYRLLVTSFASGTTTLRAFDCRGRARAIAAGAPHVEGGIAGGTPHLRPFRRHADCRLRGKRPDLLLWSRRSCSPCHRIRTSRGWRHRSRVGRLRPAKARSPRRRVPRGYGSAGRADERVGQPADPRGHKPVSRQPSPRRAGCRDRGRCEDNRRSLCCGDAQSDGWPTGL